MAQIIIIAAALVGFGLGAWLFKGPDDYDRGERLRLHDDDEAA